MLNDLHSQTFFDRITVDKCEQNNLFLRYIKNRTSSAEKLDH